MNMNLKEKIVIAIDGYSSCGKSTFAKMIAKKLSYIFIDTGAMYRAVSYFALSHKLINNKTIDVESLKKRLPEIQISFKKNKDGKICTFLNNENIENEIRGVQVSQLVSEVSKIREVRQYLVHLQQEMGKNKGIVMDGRDIGTVVFPGAEIKIFMTASTDVRAERRYKELIGKGLQVSFDEIKKNIKERDYNDINRKESPLKKADDAIVLDNSLLDLDQQMSWFDKILTDNV
jgi:cytidylate kinase